MAWAIWLAVPLAVTLLAALASWLVGRPPRPQRTAQTMAGHRAYLAALAPGRDVVAPGRDDVTGEDVAAG